MSRSSFQNKIIFTIVDVERLEKVKTTLKSVGVRCSEGEKYVYVCDALLSNNIPEAERLIRGEPKDYIEAEKMANIADGNVNIYLLLATISGSKSTVRMLLESGADINSRSKHLETPLYIATRHGHNNIAQLLVERGANISAKRDNGWSPLPLATANGNEQLVNLFLSFGADINATTSYTLLTPLSIAAEKNNLPLVQLLLANGADTNIKNSNKETAIHFAALNCNREMVLLLLAHGADIDSRSRFNFPTPLHLAIAKRDKEFVQLLLDNNADMLIRNDHGETCLQIACTHSYFEMAEFLLEAGADPNTELTGNGKYETLLFCAIYTSSDNNIVKLLLEYGATVDQHFVDNKWTELHVVSDRGNKDFATWLLQCGANPNAKTKFNETPLHKAVRQGYVEIVDVLLTNGSNVSILNCNGVSALHLAAQEGKTEITELLLRRGDIDVNCLDKKGISPFQSAWKGRHLQTLEVLLQYGANIDLFFRKPESCDVKANIRHVKPEMRPCDMLIIKHLIRHKAAGLFASRIIKKLNLSNNQELMNYDLECVAEVEKMKKIQIGNSFISYYDILSKNVRKISKYLQNFSLLNTLESLDFKLMFPNYGDLIEIKFNKGYKRNILHDSGIKCVGLICPRELPFLCTDEMVKLLCNQDIENLLEACTSAYVKNALLCGQMETDDVECVLNIMKEKRMKEEEGIN